MRTAFEFGFSIKGKRRGDVGEDLVGIFKAPADMATPTYEGTPLDIDTANDGYVKVTADGERPEFLLTSRVNDALEDIHMYEGIIKLDETQPDEPVTMVRFKKGAIIRTALIKDGYTPTAGDEVYYEAGELTDTDPTGDTSGVVVGEVKQVIDGRVRVLLK